MNMTKTKDWAKVIAESEKQEEATKPNATENAEPLLKNEQADLKLEHPEYEELTTKLAEMEVKVNEYWNTALRAKADLDNVQKRAEKDISEAHKYALKNFVMELLPIIDSLENGINSCQTAAEKTGLELTLTLFLNVMKKFGTVQIDPLNEEFDHNLHQAISVEENTAVKPNTVLKVLQKGYTLNGRLIRPALVIVSKA
jgi:molecular chaperone GrpE